MRPDARRRPYPTPPQPPGGDNPATSGGPPGLTRSLLTVAPLSYAVKDSYILPGCVHFARSESYPMPFGAVIKLASWGHRRPLVAATTCAVGVELAAPLSTVLLHYAACGFLVLTTGRPRPEGTSIPAASPYSLCPRGQRAGTCGQWGHPRRSRAPQPEACSACPMRRSMRRAGSESLQDAGGRPSPARANIGTGPIVRVAL